MRLATVNRTWYCGHCMDQSLSRLAKDFEALIEPAAAWLIVASIKLLRRILVGRKPTYEILIQTLSRSMEFDTIYGISFLCTLDCFCCLVIYFECAWIESSSDQFCIYNIS
jgi:hypothetical protein